MTQALADLPPGLELAWLARYLERSLDPDETRAFEIYLLQRPGLIALVEADNDLRAAFQLLVSVESQLLDAAQRAGSA